MITMETRKRNEVQEVMVIVHQRSRVRQLGSTDTCYLCQQKGKKMIVSSFGVSQMNRVEAKIAPNLYGLYGSML